MSKLLWRTIKIRDVLEIKNGKGLPSSKRIKGEFPVFSSAGLCDTHNSPLTEKACIIIGRKGTVGSLYLSKKPCYIIDTAYYIEDNSSIYDLGFIYYMLKIMNLSSLNTHTSVPGLNRESIYSLEINLPDLQTQKKIADLLSSLDDKIDANNKINQELEELGQALYTKWFVNFDFPNEEGKPYKSSGGEMIESELGMIPKGWKVEELRKQFNIKYGKDFTKKNIIEKGFPIYGSNGLIGFSEEYDFDEPKFIVGCRGTVGYFRMTPSYSSVSANALIFNFDDKCNFSYFYYFLKNLHFKKVVTGSVQKQITTQNINRLEMLVPSMDVRNKFNEIIYVLLMNTEQLKSENKKLEELRDFLIPQLMSGNLEIKDISVFI